MNKFIAIGRLTKDPEISTSQSGTQIARFSIAVDRKFKKEGQPTADFFNCTSFNKQATFVEKYLRKGTKIVVTGPIQNDTYTTKTGEKKTASTIMVEEIEFAEGKSEENKDTTSSGSNDFLKVTIPLEELPFS